MKKLKILFLSFLLFFSLLVGCKRSTKYGKTTSTKDALVHREAAESELVVNYVKIDDFSSGPYVNYGIFPSTVADITGDGVPESISLELTDEAGCEGLLKINDRKIKIVPFSNAISDFHIVDIDKNDSYKEIFIHSAGPSDDDEYHIYWFDGDEIHYLGKVSRWPEFCGDGILIVGDWAGWWCVKRKYLLTKDRKLQLLPQKYYEVRDRFGKEIKVKVVKELFIYESPQAEKIVAKLYPGESIKFLSCDGYSMERENWIDLIYSAWYEVETEDGKIRGWTNNINPSTVEGLPIAD